MEKNHGRIDSMSQVNSQGKKHATKQKEKKESQQKNVRPNGSKASHSPSKEPIVKQRVRGDLPTLEDGKTLEVKSHRSNKIDHSKTRSTGPKEQVGSTLGKGKTAKSTSETQHDTIKFSMRMQHGMQNKMQCKLPDKFLGNIIWDALRKQQYESEICISNCISHVISNRQFKLALQT